MNKNIKLFIVFFVVITFMGCGGGGGSGGGSTPPVTKASNDSANTNVDSAVTINVLTNDTVVDGGTLSIMDKTDGTSGSVNINADNTLTYTPNSGFSGTDMFNYTVSDGKGGTSSGTVTVHVGTPPNTDPVAVDDNKSTAKDVAVVISVLTNDSDADGDPLTVTSVTQGSNGSVVINSDNTVTYTPTAGFTGSDSFTYTISDGKGGSSTATVSVNVNAITGGPYLPYVADNNNIYVFDKDNPSSPISITSDFYGFTSGGDDVNGDITALVRGLSVNTSASTATFTGPELLVYAGSDKFWKVDMAAGSNLTPIPLMTETYTELCKVKFEEDSLTLENSLLFYELPGADGKCTGTATEAADNTRWMMRVAKSAIYSAVDITDITDYLERIVPVMDGPSNDLVGMLSIKNSEFRHYNAALDSYTVIAALSDPSSRAASTVDHNQMDTKGGFIFIDGVIHWYDFSTKALSAALHTPGTGMYPYSSDCDATECVVQDSSVLGGSSDIDLYLMPSDGSGSSIFLATVTGGFGSAWSSLLTPDYFYVAKQNGELIQVARSGGAITSIDSNVAYFAFSSHGKMYYSRGGDAVIRAFDGSEVDVIPNAAWAGVYYKTLSLVSFSESNAERLFLARKASGMTDYSGATLESYDPSTGLKDLDLGTYPTGTTGAEYSIFSLESGGVLGRINAGGQSDLIWIDPETANSLKRLTNDSAFEIGI